MNSPATERNVTTLESVYFENCIMDHPIVQAVGALTLASLALKVCYGGNVYVFQK